MNRKKLLLHERVEVRQFEEGLRGSWYSGGVVSVSHLCRSVQYDELLSETEESYLIENIPVTDAIEGQVAHRRVSPTYRGCIRPLPQAYKLDTLKIRFGMCVDVWFEDAWWEGVVFDSNDDADERLVFFPDEGDEQKFKLSHMRMSVEWDEFYDIWKERGLWLLVELAMELDEDLLLPGFLKEVWCHLRNKNGFSKKVSEWTCGAKTFWKKHFCDTVRELQVKSGRYGHAMNKLSSYKFQKNRNSKVMEDISTFNCSYNTDKIAGPSAVKSKAPGTSGRGRGALTPKQCNRGQTAHSGPITNVVPRKCGRLESKLATVSFGCRKKCSVRRRLLNSDYNQDSSEQDNLSFIEQEKELGSGTVDDLLTQRLESRPSCSGCDESSTKGICSSDAFQNFRNNNKASCSRKRKRGCRGRRPIDTICSTCHDDGDLITCARCHSSYHLICVDLKDVPDKTWRCPACFCGLCGLGGSMSDDPYFLNICLQCSREYHVDCLKKTGGAGNQFPIFCASGVLCSETCYKLYAYLHNLSESSNPTAVDGVTWTMLKSMKEESCIPGVAKVNTCKKLSLALDVIHECFEPSVEPHTKRDLVKDLVYSSMSKLRRLNFHGFYVMALEKDGDIVTVATVRIHGLKVAEMPLIATHFKYRKQGMCRLLVNELEKLLTQLKVERLVLPAISQLRETWGTAFGFQEMSHSERMELLGYPILGFHGTSMFQKYLLNPRKTDPTAYAQMQKINLSADEKHRPGRSLKVNNSSKSKQNKNGGLKEKSEDRTLKNVYRRRRVLASIESRTTVKLEE